jgi:hypothetical protein
MAIAGQARNDEMILTEIAGQARNDELEPCNVRAKVEFGSALWYTAGE